MVDRATPKGVLYLIPTPIAPTSARDVLPAPAIEIVTGLRHFLAEHQKSARAFLKSIPLQVPLQELDIATLDKHTPDRDLPRLMQPLSRGDDMGLMSDAGCPGIADPGARAVLAAHVAGIRVEPMVGPCSFVLALMASGLQGQAFCFHGYLPRDRGDRKRALKRLEQKAMETGVTQIFMETPYRSQTMLSEMLAILKGETFLSVSRHLTSKEEVIRTDCVKAWRKSPPELGKQPCVFLLGSG